MHVLLGLIEGLCHRYDLLPAVDDELRLLEQVVEHLGLVELLQQLALEGLLRMADQRERDCFWHHVDQLALDNVEV